MAKFKRVNEHAAVGGVCGGFAYYAQIPTWIVRLAVFLGVFFWGLSVVPYILLYLFVPEWNEDPADYEEVTLDD